MFTLRLVPVKKQDALTGYGAPFEIIESFKGISMSDLDVVAVATTPRAGSACGSKNGRASGSGNIGTAMIGDLAGERILPIAEQSERSSRLNCVDCIPGKCLRK